MDNSEGYENHYGMATRQNTNSLYAMNKSVSAVLHHSMGHDSLEMQHRYCPLSAESWCKYQRDKVPEVQSTVISYNDCSTGLFPVFQNQEWTLGTILQMQP